MMRVRRLDTLYTQSFITRRTFSSKHPLHRELKTPEEISTFLSESSWSVRSLLPTPEALDNAHEVTPSQLRHLLRLSALPPPSSPEQEARMLRDLHAQLHFVRQIQSVDTEGVEPLRALRDENLFRINDELGMKGRKLGGEIGLTEMKEALAAEEVVGKYHKRIRRRKGVVDEEARRAEDWDILGQAGKRVGRYFVVESGREKDKDAG